MEIQKKKFGQAELFYLKAGRCKLAVTNYGATLVSLIYEKTDKTEKDVILGYDTLEEYEKGTTYFGAAVGRNANRIRNGVYELDGKKYQMAINENENNLHSGPNGYDKRLWNVKTVPGKENTITFSLHSPEGDQGHPGNLDVTVTYTLTEEQELKIEYRGISDQDTIFNMTNHSYYNLDGHDSEKIEDHEIKICASEYTPIDAQLIPDGRLEKVEGTPFDFRKFKRIGEHIGEENTQLKYGGGYDHNFVLEKEPGELKEAADVRCRKSGIGMKVLTDLPGIQFYAGNGIGEQTGKGGVSYHNRSGLCLETQFFPDSINQKQFQSPVLKKGKEFRSTTIYRFYDL